MPYQDISKLGQRREPDPKTFSALAAEALAKDPEWIYGNVLPIAKNREDGSYSAALPGFLRDYLSGWADLITGPSVGENLSPQAVLSILGPGPVAATSSPSVVIGPGARFFDYAKSFKNPIKGGDDVLRNSIDDAAFGLKPDWQHVLPAENVRFELKDVFQHPELFANYPDLEMATVDFSTKLPKRTSGSYNAINNAIKLNANDPFEQQMGTALHEIQHWIQNFEGMQQGSAPANFLPGDFNTTRGIFDALQPASGGKLYLNRSLTAPEAAKVKDALNELTNMERNAFNFYEAAPGELEARAVYDTFMAGSQAEANMFSTDVPFTGVLNENVLLPKPYNLLDMPASSGIRPDYLRDRQQYSPDLQLTANLLAGLLRRKAP